MATRCRTLKTFPTGPTFATIYFHGFVALCFDDKRCLAGINRNALDHVMNFQVMKRGALPCEAVDLSPWLPSDFATGNHTLHISVSNPVEKGVFVFDPIPPGDPVDGRYSYVHYGFDMEGPEMHNRRVKKQPSALWPRFDINSGLYYTYKVSQSTFELDRGGVRSREKPIGLVLAADIYVKSGGSIGFHLDGATEFLRLEESTGEKYEIAITNSCTAEDPPPLKTDFYKNYEAILSTDVPTSERFDLYLKHDSGIRIEEKFGPCEMGDTHFGDPAPCLPVTFGQSTNLD